MKPEVQRFLIWAVNFTPNQKYLGWSEADWALLSTRDMCLFYNCLFFYTEPFAMAYLILLKQLSPEKLEAKLITGGLSNIPSMALMNFLRILLIRVKDFRWRRGNLEENIPVIQP